MRVYYNAGVYFVPSLAMMSLLPAVGIAPPGSTWALMQDTILATVSLHSYKHPFFKAEASAQGHIPFRRSMDGLWVYKIDELCT